MIPYPTKKFFRQQLFFGLLLWFAMKIIVYTNYGITSIEMENLISWNYYGAYFSSDIIWWISICSDLSYAIGIITMIFFKGWGRILVIGHLGCSCMLTALMGMVIHTGMVDMMLMISGVLIWFPLVLSFFDPCSKYFENDHGNTA